MQTGTNNFPISNLQSPNLPISQSPKQKGGKFMTELCQHVKTDGQYCRASAIWGSEPPRCPSHRQDGGPKPTLFQKGRSHSRLGALQHGFFGLKNLGLDSLEDETAAHLIIHQRLSTLIAAEPAGVHLAYLYRLYNQTLYRLFKKLDQYHQETGQHPDKLLEQASSQGVARIRARLEALQAQREADLRPSHPNPAQRSPRYWLIYDFIVSFIERYSVSPTRRQIMKACQTSTKGKAITYWLDQLERDGLITREPGRWRNIRLVGRSPLQPRLPLFDAEAELCPNRQTD
jgi:hypothetical protein